MTKAHYWQGPKGEDWTPEAESDNCRRCGSTPDTHLPRPGEWALDEARQIIARLGPSYIAPYHTRVRRERELAARLMVVVSMHSSDLAS